MKLLVMPAKLIAWNIFLYIYMYIYKLIKKTPALVNKQKEFLYSGV